jgi:Txe/YoeB family toxin of Txe-Axe toxin-antitoxin module
MLTESFFSKLKFLKVSTIALKKSLDVLVEAVQRSCCTGYGKQPAKPTHRKYLLVKCAFKKFFSDFVRDPLK